MVERELKLNLVFIWTQLYVFYIKKSWIEVNGAELTYMALLLFDIFRDVIYLRDFFFSSLRLYRYIKGALEIIFDSGIILNITDVLFSPKIVPVDMEKLLFNGGKLYLNYLF